MATNTKEFRVKNGLEISSGPIKINGSSGSSGQVLSSTGSGVQWVAPTTGSGTGDVVGPASSTINAVVRFDGTTGKLIKNSSGVTIDDSSNITTSGSLTVSGNATFDTNTLFVDATNDRVGVGTVSPSQKLEVVNGYSTFAGLRIGGTDTNVNQIWQSNSGTTLGITANGGAIVFGQTSSEQMRLTSGGSLGVGTSSPDGKLEVSGKLKVRGTTSANDLVQVWGVSGGSGSYSTLELIKTADTSGNFIFRGFTAGGTGTAPKIAFGNWSATPFDGAQMTLDTSSGNLGVGTNSPSAGLHISKAFGSQLRIQETGGTYFDIACGGRFDIKNGSGTTIVSIAQSGSPVGTMLNLDSSGNLGVGTASPSERLSIKSATGINSVTDIASFSNPSQTSAGVRVLFNNGYGKLGAISSFQLDNGAGADNGVLAFQTASDAVLSTKMTILDTGAVGMGTVSPSAKLDVVGTSFFLRPSSVNAVGHFDVRNDTASPVSVRLAFGTDNTGWQMRFAKNYQGTYTDYMTINDVGNIGIGTVSPAYKLDVSGTLNASGAITQSGNQVLHAGNYSSYAIPNSGSWLGDLGSYGFTRYAGMSMSGGSEVVFLYKGGQGYTLIDGNYMAFEGGGFYSSYNSSGGTLLGMKAIATNTLELTARTSIRRSAYTVGASDFFMELTAPDDGSGNGEIGLRFHLEGRYWRQIRANSGGFKFTQGSNNDTVNVTAYDVIAQNDVSASRYVNSVYFNQSSGNSENPTIGQIWTQNTTDNYCRKSTPAHFKAQMGMYHNDGTSTANRIIISTGTPTGTITNGDVWLQY